MFAPTRSALLLLVFLCGASSVESFLNAKTTSTTTKPFHPRTRRHPNPAVLLLRSVAVPASELERDLSAEEKTVVSVVRQSGPAVAFVTSLLPVPQTDGEDGRGLSRRRRRRRRQPLREKDDDIRSNIPRGRSLGSGSGFLVDARGYLVTNYHVIEQASRLQTTAKQIEEFQAQIAGNVTNYFPTVNGTALLQQLLPMEAPLPEVFVRIDSATNYQRCRIVEVRPELDVAVLKIVNETTTLPTPLQFGSSSNLLVGQGLIAIGNPFGLSNSVTTGVVSALNREIQTSSTRTPIMMMPQQPIRNCIQTDCAINPGNSGGPLLNRKGSVVGVNTAILTTSGSNTGVGFAIEADQVEPVVTDMIRRDVARGTRRLPWLGVSIVRNDGNATTTTTGCRVAQVERNSPADEAGIRGLTIFEQDASVQYGDSIVAVGGNLVNSLEELRSELDTRAVGEQLQITLRNASGDKRVVYLTLRARPSEA